jgi:hypothetical protein
MNRSEIKELLIRSLDADSDPGEASSKLEDAGVSYDFNDDFTDKVLTKIFPVAAVVKREIEFARYLVFAFRSIAVSGIAAIILLLISIYIREGSLSLDSFLGLRDNYDESIVCLLTGK